MDKEIRKSNLESLRLFGVIKVKEMKSINLVLMVCVGSLVKGG